MKKSLYKTDQSHPAIQAYREAVKKGKASQHVVFEENRWLVKQGVENIQSSQFGTQQEAIKYGQVVAQGAGTALFIHGLDGRISQRFDYS